MAFWNRDKAPSQKHSIIEVIKYDGPNDILVWKFPNEDFNTNTQLIVGPSQEAIFVKEGRVIDSLIPGTYTLETKNHPFLRPLVGLATGGVSPFSCSVYYVNKAISMGIDWGTDTPISVVEPIYGVPIDVRSYGDFSLQVENGLKFMEKLVGQTNGYSHQEIQQYFSNIMAVQVRGVISSTMLERQLSPIGIDMHLADMSKAVEDKLQPIFELYGMKVNHFAIAAITAPELDTIKQKAREIQKHRMETDSIVEDKRKMAVTQRFENDELNVTEQQKLAAQIGKKLADNSGTVVGNVVGLNYVGRNVVNPASTGAADIARMLINQSEQPSHESKDSKGERNMKAAHETFEERAQKVKYLFDNGMITQEQYQEKINELLSGI